jgi:uncharacterized protein (TIGR02284 family)
MTYHPDHIEALNDLIEINRDRVKGYERAAADLAETHGVNAIQSFNQYKRDSEQFVEELSRHVRNMGGEPATGSTIGGMIHRAWIDVKTALSIHEKESALESCIFGDEAAIKSYETTLALEEPALHEPVKAMLNRQLTSIRSAQHTNKVYEEQLENAKVSA